MSVMPWHRINFVDIYSSMFKFSAYNIVVLVPWFCFLKSFHGFGGSFSKPIFKAHVPVKSEQIENPAERVRTRRIRLSHWPKFHFLYPEIHEPFRK